MIYKMGYIKLSWLVNNLSLCKWLEVDQAKCPQLVSNSPKLMYHLCQLSLFSVICSIDAKITETKEHKNKKDFIGLIHVICSVLRHSWLCSGISYFTQVVWIVLHCWSWATIHRHNALVAILVARFNYMH